MDPSTMSTRTTSHAASQPRGFSTGRAWITAPTPSVLVSIAERIVSRVPAAAPLTRRTTVAPGSRKMAVGSSSESSLSDVDE